MTDACKDCKYYASHGNDAFGECHRYPKTYNYKDNEYLFPEHQDIDWCGEFLKIEELTPSIDLTNFAKREDKPDHTMKHKSGFNTCRGPIYEGDAATIKGSPCKIVTIYKDGDAEIEYPNGETDTVKWHTLQPWRN